YQVQQQATVVKVGGRSLDDQRQTICIRQHMAFATVFGSIGRIGTGVSPPKTARTLALSTTARSRFTAPALPRVFSNRACSLGHTASFVQSAKRRQHVLPLPQPISVGRVCQGMPVRSTNTMPVSASRFCTLGRPPLGDGGGMGGNNGSIF